MGIIDRYLMRLILLNMEDVINIKIIRITYLRKRCIN